MNRSRDPFSFQSGEIFKSKNAEIVETPNVLYFLVISAMGI